ncbi:MAG: LEA type 2 family protein [Proteobacteria bacterium]|jgi:LEA14-like dessication related protein|nr:LEA type 2 family protein [Pseudomonadota bacterium]MBK7117008.1 LEA type 2 family protein [Pseudomonadota bacterium]MBK9250724.1 LEA type 2 family protein [Pseudomonadota bacterium]MCC6632781.1 LEA type 2 family protein [Gammaproteobacteria bacterium]
MKAMRVLTALVLLAGLAGCAYARLEKPTLQVVDVQMLKGDLLQQQLKLRMRVQNPNDRELPVAGITYELAVAGEAFAHGESERNFIVPALGSAEFDVNVTANAATALLKILAGGRKLETVDYRLTGKVALSSGMLRSIPFDQKGVVNLR